LIELAGWVIRYDKAGTLEVSAGFEKHFKSAVGSEKKLSLM